MDQQDPINLLAFDLGASSGRAILGTLLDKKLEIETIHRFPNESIRIFKSDYWNLLGLFKEMKNALKIYTKKELGDLHGIGVDTWGVDFVLLDQNDELVGLPHTYRDHRTDGIQDKMLLVVPKEEIFTQTGIQFMQLNSSVQLYSLVLSKSSQLSIVKTILMIPDYINFLLSGIKASEYSIATTSQLCNPVKKDWAHDLIKSLGFEQNWFKNVVPPATIIGNLRDDLKNELGLKGETKIVAPLCHDTGSAVAAVPVDMDTFKEGEWAYLSSGTWSLLGVELESPRINNTVLEMNFTNEGGIGGTIRFLKNITGLWLIQECKRIWDLKKEIMWDQILSNARKADSFQFFINPDEPEFLNPSNMINAIQNYCKNTNQGMPRTIGEISRLVFESLAFKYREIFEVLENLIEKKIKILHIIGGGSQNELLNQFTSNSLNIPVESGPSEATAIGNILVQAMALGKIRDIVELRKIVRDSFKITNFEPIKSKEWQKAFIEYKEKIWE